MTSQRQIEDEMLAKRLQSEEFRAAQGTPTRSPISQSDEELARRLATEENNPPATRVIIASSNNNRPTVKLHQTATGRQIGETLVVHSFTADEIALELSSKSGYYLRVRDTGAVEFNVPTVGYIDDFYRFRVFILSNGSCYLMNKAYLQSTNRIGGRGWHLTILPNGQLCGNGPRDSSAEWALLNLQTQLPLFHPATGYVASSSGVAPPPAPALSYQINQQPFVQSTQFPGLGAGKDELMRYFSTPTGVQFLTQSEYLPAYQLYQRNLLSRILHRPDWPFLASRFRDFLSEPVKFQQSIVDHFATKDSLSQFFEQGWTMIPNVVTPDALNNARKIIQYWQFKSLSQAPQGHNGVKKGRGYSTELTGDVMIDFDLLSLYYMSPLPHIMEELMGVDEVDHPKFCRVTSVFPSLDLTESPALFGDKWTIEGFTSTPQFSHSPYNILVGVALTDIPDIDMGNFCIHPGSHVVLLEEYKKKAEQHQTLFSENPYLVQKPDLGPPTQLKMKAGDAFFCTQRAATLLSANTRADPTIFAFFEVSHVDHAVMKDPALQSMWLEYKNASRYLKDENAGIIFAPAVVVSHDLLAAQYQTQRREEPLPDVSSVHVSTTASPVSTSVVSAYPSATASAAPIVYTSSATSSSSVALNRSPSLTEEYAPATNPMFSSNTAGYSALPAVDDDDDRTSTGPIRPSNQIQLNTFPSGQRRKDGEHDLLL